MAKVEELARTPALDAHVQPVEMALTELPEVRATPEGAARLRNGNPGLVVGQDVEYGETAWASYEGRPVAIGRFQSGALHPTRVLNLGD